jgi:hypothetical protein
MNIDSVVYKNINFPVRKIHMEKWGNVLIATEKLRDSLFPNDDYNYYTATQQQIDESIFYFVDDELINYKEEFLIAAITTEIY